MEAISSSKEKKRQMEMKKDERKEIEVFCYEQRLLSHIRSVKLVRDIGKGVQRRLAEWVL